MKFIAAIIAVALAACLPASAVPASKGDVVAYLQRLGITEINSNVADDRDRVDAVYDGLNFSVKMNFCAADGGCNSVMFFTVLDTGRAETLADYQRINYYNNGAIYGRAFVIPAKDGRTASIGVDYVADLTPAGHSIDQVNFSNFVGAMTSFLSLWSQTTTPAP